jgi:hypothetical protein
MVRSMTHLRRPNRWLDLDAFACDADADALTA